MPQIFPKNTNAFVRYLIFGGGILGLLLLISLPFLARTTNNAVGVPVAQPIDYPHNLHVAQLGLDCRYCHTTVEIAATASIPPTETCMTCHSQLRTDSPAISELIASWESQTPIAWNRVHDMPEYVFFDHSAHINNGVGCSTCHGQIDQMEGIWKNEPMTMGWCLECHRNPAAYLRPRSEVFNMAYKAPDGYNDQLALGNELVAEYHVNLENLPQCSTCHR